MPLTEINKESGLYYRLDDSSYAYKAEDIRRIKLDLGEQLKWVSCAVQHIPNHYRDMNATIDTNKLCLRAEVYGVMHNIPIGAVHLQATLGVFRKKGAVKHLISTL